MQFSTYEDKAGKWRWRVIAENGEKVGSSSQGFTRISTCIKNAKMLRVGLNNVGPV